MSRGPQRVHQREVARVLRAVEKSGVQAQIKIVPKEGAIFIIPGTLARQDCPGTPAAEDDLARLI